MALFTLTLLLIAIAAFVALRFGEQPEKFGAFIILGMAIANLVGHRIFSFHYAKIDPVSAVTDVAGFGCFLAIALFARRIWPIWASSLQLIATLAHVVRLLDWRIHPIAYAVMSWGPTDLIPLVLICAGIVQRQRRHLRGNASPWRNWSARSSRTPPMR